MESSFKTFGDLLEALTPVATDTGAGSFLDGQTQPIIRHKQFDIDRDMSRDDSRYVEIYVAYDVGGNRLYIAEYEYEVGFARLLNATIRAEGARVIAESCNPADGWVAYSSKAPLDSGAGSW